MKKRTYWQWFRIGLGLHIGVLVLFIGGFIGFILFQSFFRQSRLEPIRGTVLRSVAVPRGDGWFTANVRFSYTVDRRKYNGGKYRDGVKHLGMSEFEAKAIIQKYPSGANVEAWYDPKSPSYAVIDRSLGILHYGCLIVIGGLVAAGTLIFVVSRRHRARHAST